MTPQERELLQQRESQVLHRLLDLVHQHGRIMIEDNGEQSLAVYMNNQVAAIGHPNRTRTDLTTALHAELCNGGGCADWIAVKDVL